MSRTQNPAPSTKRQRRKQPQRLISAAVSIPPDLYDAALSEARRSDENNFSRYVRRLIATDLAG